MSDRRRRTFILFLGLMVGTGFGYMALHGPAAAIARISSAIPTY